MSMLNNIPLSLLRAFEAAGRSGSFRAAAAELGLTPSAVSHAIRKLEDLLGVRLFQRRTRAIELTTEGQILMRHVGDAFDSLRHGLEAVSTRTPRLLRLHVAPSFATQWLAPRLNRFLEANPRAEVRIAASTDYAEFSRGTFDADIVYAAAPTARAMPGLVRISLGEETVIPLCAPALAARIRHPADLLGETLIHSDNKMLRWPDWFSANGLSAPGSHGLRFDRSFLAISMAADGLGVALESTRLAEREIAGGRLVAPLQGRSVDLHYTAHFLVYPRTHQANPLISRFSAWLQQQLSAVRD
ncbi:MAG TPA: LysR substrate-binding domain-containing protein, partial [Acetobacteraceae bacterium]|nr:LysR substrate-binding domain-containing protein [Acetobacteraceae bacterium]